jgi:hypothetical protein
VHVQARQVNLCVGVVGLLFEGLLVLLQRLLQRAEIQADGIRVKAEQGVHHGKAYALFVIVKQRPQHQAALGGRQQPADLAMAERRTRGRPAQGPAWPVSAPG